MCKKSENWQKSSNNRSVNGAQAPRAQKLALFAPGGASASILAAPKRSRALFLAPWAGLGDSPGAPGTLLGRSQDDHGACLEHSGWSLGASWAPRGARKAPGSNFKSILGAPGIPLEAILYDLGVDFHVDFCHHLVAFVGNFRGFT